MIVINKVQRNRNNHKEYPVLRNIPIPFTRIGIEFLNIPILFNRSRIAFLNILYLQNFYRILQNMKMQDNQSWKVLYIKYCKYDFSRMNQVKQTDSNLSSNVQIHTGKILNMTPSEASLAFFKADLPTTELGEVTILPLLLFTFWKVQGMSLGQPPNNHNPTETFYHI